MSFKRKHVWDGILFLLLGVHTLWLWFCSGLLILQRLRLDDEGRLLNRKVLKHVTFGNILDDLGIPPFVQSVCFLGISLFFILWGVWTLRLRNIDAAKPQAKLAPGRIILLALAALALPVWGYVWGQRTVWKQAREYINSIEKHSIPANLAQCFDQIDLMISEEDREIIMRGTEEDMIMYHHGLGTAVRNSFGLWRGPLIGSWFREHGVDHPDNMSGIILDLYWRHLNNRPLDVNQCIRETLDYYKESDPDYYAEIIARFNAANAKEQVVNESKENGSTD